MKKLEKLTLKELETCDQVIYLNNKNEIIGGNDDPDLTLMTAPGWADYLDRYGQRLPPNTSYDPYTDTCSYYDPTVGTTDTIGGSDRNKLYDDYWRSGRNGPDESSTRTDTPLFEWLWKELFGDK